MRNSVESLLRESYSLNRLLHYKKAATFCTVLLEKFMNVAVPSYCKSVNVQPSEQAHTTIDLIFIWALDQTDK